jgi:hypothetical protein
MISQDIGWHMKDMTQWPTIVSANEVIGFGMG